MTEPVVISASSLQTYLRCGYQWYLAYVVQLKSPPNIRQVIGLATHSAIEHNMAQKIASKTDLPVSEIEDVYSDNFDSLAGDVETLEEPLGDAKDSGIKLVQLHTKEVSPGIQPIWVERAGQFEMNGIPYSWTVDLVDDKKRVRDTKTKKQRPKIEDYILGMTGYALGFRQETGEIESDIVIDGLVRLKAGPIYVPLYGGPVDDSRINTFANTLEAASQGINAGSFIPNGLTNNACSWCGFANICKYRNKPV